MPICYRSGQWWNKVCTEFDRPSKFSNIWRIKPHSKDTTDNHTTAYFHAIPTTAPKIFGCEHVQRDSCYKDELYNTAHAVVLKCLLMVVLAAKHGRRGTQWVGITEVDRRLRPSCPISTQSLIYTTRTRQADASAGGWILSFSLFHRASDMIWTIYHCIRNRSVRFLFLLGFCWVLRLWRRVNNAARSELKK